MKVSVFVSIYTSYVGLDALQWKFLIFKSNVDGKNNRKPTDCNAVFVHIEFFLL